MQETHINNVEVTELILLLLVKAFYHLYYKVKSNDKFNQI